MVEAFAASRRSAPAPLAGVPYFVKDLFDLAGAPTFAGSTFLPEVRAAQGDCAVVRAAGLAGLVCAGKTQLHEFAYGITGENPHYGDCENPSAPGRTAGGSSSGSAAAVAAGIVPIAFGSDTGGSVRVPAAFCGVYGFRLTPGDPWIRDAFPLAPSFDTAGWFAAGAADMRVTLQALLGLEAAVAAPRGCYLELPGVDAAVRLACRTAADALGALLDTNATGALRAAFFDAVSAYNTLVASEAWQAHAGWADRMQTRYDPAVWQRLARGRALTDGDLAGAHGARAAIERAWANYFAEFDFLAMPAAPCPALTKAECTLENRTRILTQTAPASVGGLPVLTVPLRLAPSGTRLTAGLQVILAAPRSSVLLWALDLAEKERGGVFV